MRRRLGAYYAYTVLRSLRFTDALWILYLLHVGWSLPVIGLAEAGFHAVAILSDVPTGLFADRFGRRLSLAIGLVLLAATTLALYALAPASLPLGALALALSALGWTFGGGADRALLYELAGEEGYRRAYGTAAALGLAVGALCAVAGGLLAARAWAWPFGLTAATQLAALAPTALLPASRPTPGPAPASVRTKRPARSGPERRLVALVAGTAAFAAAGTLTRLLAQPILVSKGLTVAATTGLLAAGDLLTAAGSYLGGRWRARSPSLAAGLVTALGLTVALGLFGVVGVGAAFLALATIVGAVDPALEAELARRVPAEAQATVFSVQGTLFSLAVAVLFPLAGWMAAHTGWVAALGLVGLLFLPALALVTRRREAAVGAADSVGGRSGA